MSMKQPTNNTMYIKQFAELTGVHPDTIRRWQAQGKLPINRNKLNNWRIFTESDVKKVNSLMGKNSQACGLESMQYVKKIIQKNDPRGA